MGDAVLFAGLAGIVSLTALVIYRHPIRWPDEGPGSATEKLP